MYEYVTNLKGIANFVSEIQKVNFVSLDTETDGLDCFTNKLLLIQVKVGEVTFIFDCRKLIKNDITYITQILQDSRKLIIGHNIKFDLKFIATYTGELLGSKDGYSTVHDTMIAEGLIVNGVGERFPSLAELVYKYCGVTLDKSIREEFYKNPDQEITEQQLIYSALDVEYLHTICLQQIEKLAEQKQSQILNIENRLLPVICSMELEGVALNVEKWNLLVDEARQISTELEKELLDEIVSAIPFRKFKNLLELVDFLYIPAKTKKLRKELESIEDLDAAVDYIKRNINLSSNKQLLNILVNVFGVVDKKKKPIDSTNEKVIDKFAEDYPIIKKVMSYREQQKKVTSFGDNFLSNIHPVTKRIHTNYEQLGAGSGRIASSRINLQNIPKDQKYRSPFEAREGYYILGVDFSQEELRLMAKVTKAKNMIEAYKNGEDLHTRTASEIFEVPVEQVTKEQRYKGKTANFAVGYGSTEYGLYKNFGIPLKEGKEVLDKFYNKAYPEIRDFKASIGEVIWSKEFSTTLTGRKRYFQKPKIFADGNERERFKSSTLRELLNHIIQGTGADIIKKALCRIYYENPFGSKLKILMQVYDEIVCEVSEDIAEEAKEFVCRVMKEVEEEYLEGIVPAEVSAELERYWKH